MRFDMNKAFPYPVLRPYNDDYINSEFQATVELKVNEDNVIMDISYAISSDDILKQIEIGNADFIAVVSCRETYFRHAIRSDINQAKSTFKVTDFKGEVRINPFVVAKQKITNFTSSDINSEFGNVKFNFLKGEILAQDEPKIIFIERDYFKPITSLFDLVKKDGLMDGEWDLTFDQDHVQIEVNPHMKKIIDDARNDKKNRVILVNSLYFAAVMQSIQKIKDSSDEFEGRRWANVMKKQAHNMGIDLDSTDAYSATSSLLKYPLNVLGASVFRGDN